MRKNFFPTHTQSFKQQLDEFVNVDVMKLICFNNFTFFSTIRLGSFLLVLGNFNIKLFGRALHEFPTVGSDLGDQVRGVISPQGVPKLSVVLYEGIGGPADITRSFIFIFSLPFCHRNWKFLFGLTIGRHCNHFFFFKF